MLQSLTSGMSKRTQITSLLVEWNGFSNPWLLSTIPFFMVVIVISAMQPTGY